MNKPMLWCYGAMVLWCCAFTVTGKNKVIEFQQAGTKLDVLRHQCGQQAVRQLFLEPLSPCRPAVGSVLIDTSQVS
jgi:hypothetical protein